MKKIVFLFLLLVGLTNCEHEITEDKYAINIDMKIVGMNFDGSTQTDDKFHTPQACNIILFETVKGPKLYREINTCEMPSADIHINNVWIYNHKLGDIVHFDYLLKSEFFEIKERNETLR